MPVHDIVAYARGYGGDLGRVQQDFPYVSLEQLQACVEYYHAHSEEIEDILRRRQEAYDQAVGSRTAATS